MVGLTAMAMAMAMGMRLAVAGSGAVDVPCAVEAGERHRYVVDAGTGGRQHLVVEVLAHEPGGQTRLRVVYTGRPRPDGPDGRGPDLGAALAEAGPITALVRLGGAGGPALLENADELQALVERASWRALRAVPVGSLPSADERSVWGSAHHARGEAYGRFLAPVKELLAHLCASVPRRERVPLYGPDVDGWRRTTARRVGARVEIEMRSRSTSGPPVAIRWFSESHRQWTLDGATGWPTRLATETRTLHGGSLLGVATTVYTRVE